MPKFYSELQNAALENLSSDPANVPAGRIIRNTTDGKVKISNGTAYKNVILNDGNAIIGTSGTAASNVRLHRGAAEVLQFVPGSDATAEGTLATTLAQTSSQVENYDTGSLPTAGNAGRLLFDSTTTQLKLDNGSAIKVIGPSPTTTKGDLIVNNGSADIRLAVGTNTNILTADSAETSGLKWIAAPSLVTLPTQQKFTTGSGTYTTPANCRYIKIRMIGGGGSGAGGGIPAPTSGTAGNATTFDTLSAGGGSAGNASGGSGGAGGTNTFSGVGLSLQGGMGAPGPVYLGGSINGGGGGGNGGSGFFGGAGAGGHISNVGQNAAANSGGGGGGGGHSSSGVSIMYGGSGGGSGGYIEALINGPSATYSYAVGAAQTTVGSGTTAGANGGQGAAGIIIVEEYY